MFCDQFFFAFFSLFRFCISSNLVARPLVPAFFWALFTGSWETSLSIAVFFELFWLDIIPVGTFIPPVGLYSTFASLCIVHILGLHHPVDIAFVMVMTIPFASLCAWIDAKQRLLQNRSFNLLVISTRPGNADRFMPERLIRAGLVRSFIFQSVFSLVSLYILFVILSFVLPYVHHYSWFSWPVLWLSSSLGGLLSLRFRHAPVFLGSGILGTAAIIWCLALV